MSQNIDELMTYAHESVVRASAFVPAMAFLKSLGYDGGVYFLRNNVNGLTKVGCAQDVEKRTRSLNQAASLMAQTVDLELLYTMPIVPELKERLEQLVHKELSDKHVHGEWYSLSSDDVENMKALAVDYVHTIVQESATHLSERFVAAHSPHTMLGLGRAVFGDWLQPSSADVALSTSAVAHVAEFVKAHSANDWPELLQTFKATSNIPARST